MNPHSKQYFKRTFESCLSLSPQSEETTLKRYFIQAQIISFLFFYEPLLLFPAELSNVIVFVHPDDEGITPDVRSGEVH